MENDRPLSLKMEKKMKFDRIASGIYGVDRVLDNIRLGDTVVWQVSEIEEYAFFVKHFVDQAIKDNRKLTYFRFAQHEALLEAQPGLKIVELDLTNGFEAFAVQIHDHIEKEGREAFFVFDSISALQKAWAADFMVRNFFLVTCPYLYEMDTVSFFAITRNNHSFSAMERIRATTRVLIDVFRTEDELYLHPLKVWDRYSPSMFLPHILEEKTSESEEDNFVALTDGIRISKFYSLIGNTGNTESQLNLDNWERYFLNRKAEFEVTREQKPEVIRELCKMLFGSDEKLIDIANKNYKMEDLLELKKRMIGVGNIGGKAAGMLLSRKIVSNKMPKVISKLEPHDSFYIGSNLFHTYNIQNDCWDLRLRQKTPEGYFSAAKEIKEKLLNGCFSENIREQFRRMLEYYGQSPIIVRSSSLLEDGFGNAFAGKYESVFCVNVGSLDERLKAFEAAVKTVYGSTMDESALAYRLQRGLNKREEQMAILVQRVSGSLFDDIYMPCAAGVGYSYNSYRWDKDIDPTQGMIRLVMGLGTRAVDRTDGDYPRIASLDKPKLMPSGGKTGKSKFVQSKVDALCLSTNHMKGIDLSEVVSKLPEWFVKFMIEHDYEREAELRERNIFQDVIYTTCDNLLKKEEFVKMLKDMMAAISKEYDYPVDIEFAVNFNEKGEFVVNLLQCRPLQVGGLGVKVDIPDIPKEQCFFALNGGTMGGAYYQPVDVVIQIDPKAYYEFPYNKKAFVARTIGKLNQYYKDKGKAIMLLVPGRLGTSSPELGVPVSFAEISNMKITCEVAYQGAGYMPELSFGSHFFQDLVETDIFYAAIFEDENTLTHNPEFFKDEKNILEDIVHSDEDLKDIIKVWDVSGRDLSLISDVLSGKTVCGIFKQEKQRQSN